MKKLITALFCSLIGGSALAQWTPAAAERGTKLGETQVRNYYKLDLAKIQSQLKDAKLMGGNAKPVEISIPSLDGKIEKFAVYSFPVMAKELAEQYQLGSYVGVGITDPGKYIRFSVSPTNFQSMVINNGIYEFIEPQNASKTLYGVTPKTINTGGKSFVCSTEEGPKSIDQINEMIKGGQVFTNQPTDFSKSSDRKYRTMRLAISTTPEYTTYHGGTLATALSAINATMTTVNGVFEKDFALHLNVLNYPQLIYIAGSPDPYSNNLNLQLQQTLTSVVGSDNYDIGHVFNAAGNNGNAGCIGCVCLAPANNNSLGKGSAFTQSTAPIGNSFDIDFVAHEMGHQLGGNHTFAHALEGAGVNVEPGSGSTIMGYAGITGPDTDVQPNSDPFFHKVSIVQVQNNLTAKTCDVETSINNNPPVIAALPTYNIPKGTAFVLTASATDPENDPITYMWEQVNNATVTINKGNLGTTTSGATFRSFTPTTSPTRYFPKLTSVLAGVLDNSTNQWESVSQVARSTKFSVTVRDNNPDPQQQQTQSAEQTIVVGNDGPFKVLTNYINSNAPSALEWDVANTTAAPYSVANVKIDYTTDNGTTWNVLAASTANDGTENISFPTALNGQTVKVRVSSIGNVFYAVRSVMITPFATCTGAAPTNIVVSNITASSAYISWAPIVNATYKFRYRKPSAAVWTEVSLNNAFITLNNLAENTDYEVQVAAVCNGVPGAYSASVNFNTILLTYCVTQSNNFAYEYISNVTVANVNNSSVGTAYSDYTTNPLLQINVVKGVSNQMSVTVANPDYDTVAAWIDYNKNGVFESSERVFNFPVALITGPVTGSFTVPQSAITGQPMRMRVVLLYGGAPNAGGSLTGPCGGLSYGEAEDYFVVATEANLSTVDNNIKNSGIQIYPNPATDFLNVTKVSDKATYKIYSAAGQLVGNGNISNGKINVSSLIKGAYVISIEDKGKESFNSKFIKK
ncbi:reprolysin-like metallopeptidase [Chryseobacterium scophthalmum]|uniref:reprolysin-like metallopeptidase n=1 Tax=Chryseobacterium scophthalmum TaxID=59733 RepID=UPI00398B477D